MYLTREEEAMLEGKMGSGTAFAMRLLTKPGDAMGAERMIQPVSSHVVSFGFQAYGILAEWNTDLDNEMLQGVTRFRVPATTNPKFLNTDDRELATRFGLSDSTVEQIRSSLTCDRFGGTDLYCPPRLQG